MMSKLAEYERFERKIILWLGRPVDQGERNVLRALYYFAKAFELSKCLEGKKK